MGPELEEIQRKLTALLQENEELKDKYLRAAASMENARRQAERMTELRARNRLQDLYLRLIEVVDNLERALEYSNGTDALSPGVRATREQLLDVLRREGVVPIDVEPGVLFNPESQEAIETREGAVPEPTVSAVGQAGYTHEGRVLRPARVTVVRPPRHA
ncbi:MAG TPA: nucleotide exchange factor GrpE [Vicinamibacteria bacterium]|nr:nucleotide exchange factor GrpE [Vicinamibacteria bacterium]